jgi:hypothetical protein
MSTGKLASDCVHWDEDCLLNELMTPFVNPTFSLSRLTVASLEDLGYTVNYAAADAFPATSVAQNCRCNRRLGEPNESPPRTSRKLLVKTDAQKAAEAKAILFGANLLKSSQLSSASEQGVSAQTSGGTVKYIGSDWVSVFYMDPDSRTVRYAHVDATMLASGGDPVQWSPTYPFVQNP